MTGKRQLPSHDSPLLPKYKRRAIETEPTEKDQDEVEYVAMMLVPSQEKKEIEPSAGELHQEWNDSISGSHSSGLPANSSLPKQVQSNIQQHDKKSIYISDDEILLLESDEDMARRLQQEWAASDDDDVLVGSSKLLPQDTRHIDGKGKAPERLLIQPTIKVEDITGSAEESLARFRELFVRSRNCIKCGKRLSSPRGCVAFPPQVPPSSLLFLLHVPCTNCQTNHCRGCFSPVTCPISCKGNEGFCETVTCCAEVRAIALFEALGGLDKLFLGEQATTNARAKEASSKHNITGRSAGPRGTGYGTGSTASFHLRGLRGGRARGRGRGRGRGGAHNITSSSSRTATEQMASHWDELLVRAMTTITSFLPSPYAEEFKEYDILPHGSIAPLLSLAQLPELLGNLLRNDSVTDWINRSEVYSTMLGLLRRMADCELSIQAIIGQRFEMKKSCGIEDWMWQDGEIVWEKINNQLVKATPLYKHFHKLTRQCETLMTGASQIFEDGAEEDIEMMIKTTSLCGDIIAAWGDIERAMKVMGKDPTSVSDTATANAIDSDASINNKGKGIDPLIEMDRKYAQECERLAFAYVSLSEPMPLNQGLNFPNFKYSSSLTQTSSATRNPKDRLHLVKELAVMATSLPAGIWVRLDEVRNDAIKVMIAGPEGTPYAGGLFEFDCFIPLEYPHKPPLMHLRTTGGGSVRFNPNLYNCGKVCLSLLGTWPGSPEEMWSSKSTLLQVFVSIQSMILIDLPYFNEPGFGPANPSNQSSIWYNKNITKQTTRWAIVEWLKDEHKNGIWADVIHSHFTTRQANIRKCIQEWAKVEPNILQYTTLPSPLPPPLSPSACDFGEQYASSDDDEILPYKALSTSFAARRRDNASSRSAQAPSTMDLLAEFDRGMETIKKWKASTGEGGSG